MESERFFHAFYLPNCKSLRKSGPFHPGCDGENFGDLLLTQRQFFFEEYCQDSSTLKSFSCTEVVLVQNTSSLDKPDTGKEKNSICTEIC